jgi:cardiolipin synthase
LFPHQNLNAQTPVPVSREVRLDQSRARMYRTAEALGIAVYEDLPVYAGAPSQSPAAAAAQPAAKGYFQVPLVPAPEAQPAAEPVMNKGNKLCYLVLGYHAVAAQIADSGLLFWKKAAPGFDKISDSVEAAVKRSAYTPRSGGRSLLEDEGFIKEMEAVTGTRFFDGGYAEALIDGPASFEAKDRLMREARESIHVASYALYDDVTGNETTQILLAKKKEGVDIKVMVDAKMTNIFGAGVLKTLEKAGVDVVRYKDAGRSHDYLHVKMLIVDGRTAVVGGMNYGDEYSHKGNGGKWRDTDVLYTGPAVTESEKIFAEMWNAQVKEPARKVSVPAAVQPHTGTARIAVLPQNPPTLTPPILLSVVKAISGATSQVNIENAYLIAIPALNKAVLDARARGVEVNILTNSKESIDADGKSMADTILDGLKPFAAAGANVYIKQGETLHSKFMTVDGIFCNVGSYNMHPRSERYDTELNVSILDAASAAQFDEAFSRDIAAARKVTLEDLNARESGWFSRLVARVGFAQLRPN